MKYTYLTYLEELNGLYMNILSLRTIEIWTFFLLRINVIRGDLFLSLYSTHIVCTVKATVRNLKVVATILRP